MCNHACAGIRCQVKVGLNIFYSSQDMDMIKDRAEQKTMFSPLLWCSGDSHSVGSSAPIISRLLGTGNKTFSEVASMVVTWWM